MAKNISIKVKKDPCIFHGRKVYPGQIFGKLTLPINYTIQGIPHTRIFTLIFCVYDYTRRCPDSTNPQGYFDVSFFHKDKWGYPCNLHRHHKSGEDALFSEACEKLQKLLDIFIRKLRHTPTINRSMSKKEQRRKAWEESQRLSKTCSHAFTRERTPYRGRPCYATNPHYADGLDSGCCGIAPPKSKPKLVNMKSSKEEKPRVSIKDPGKPSRTSRTSCKCKTSHLYGDKKYEVRVNNHVSHITSTYNESELTTLVSASYNGEPVKVLRIG